MVKIECGEVKGYMYSSTLDGDVVKGDGACVRASDTSDSAIVVKLKGGTIVKIIESLPVWFKINYKEISGWVYSK
jgi:uncharacterized protein YgiM (DUF1202 family)